MFGKIIKTLGVVGAVGAGSLAYIFRKELASVASVKRVSADGLFMMDYKADYGLNKFLQTGARTDGELIHFVTRNLLKGLPVTIAIPDLSCTTFKAKSTEGTHLFGRNFDLDNGPSMLVRTCPQDGYASLSMVHLRFLGYEHVDNLGGFSDKLLTLAAPYIPLDGINEKGLTIGILLLPEKPTHQNTGKVPVTSTTAIRMVLDKAATVDEAIVLLQQHDMHDSAGCAYHYQISDATGASVVVEYINNKLQVIRPQEEYQAATNFYLHDSKEQFGYGHDRYEKVINKLKSQNGVITAEEGMAILSEVKLENYMDDFSNKPSWTMWSAIYHNNEGRVDIATHRNYNNIYTFTL